MPIYIGILWLAYWERIQEREKMKKWNRKKWKNNFIVYKCLKKYLKYCIIDYITNFYCKLTKI